MDSEIKLWGLVRARHVDASVHVNGALRHGRLHVDLKGAGENTFEHSVVRSILYML